ncbi:MAG: T9SS type A sorting domain-containing protein [Fibrobacteria bacterium]|nr:T9SS type A sorting domain-containing protein [Fibrobacteria bacterium]
MKQKILTTAFFTIILITGVIPVFAGIPNGNMVMYRLRFLQNLTSKAKDGNSTHFEELVEAGVTSVYIDARKMMTNDYTYWEWMNEAQEYGLFVGSNIFNNNDGPRQFESIVNQIPIGMDYIAFEYPWPTATCKNDRMDLDGSNTFPYFRGSIKTVRPDLPIYVITEGCYNRVKELSGLEGYIALTINADQFPGGLANANDYNNINPSALSAVSIWARGLKEDDSGPLDNAVFSSWFSQSFTKTGNVMLRDLFTRSESIVDTRLPQIKALTGGTPVPSWQNFSQSTKAGAIDAEVQVKSAAGLDPASIECYYAQEMTGRLSKWIRHYQVSATGTSGSTDWITIKAERIPFDSIGTGEELTGNRVRFKITDTYQSAKIRNARKFKRDFGIEITEPVFSGYSGRNGVPAQNPALSIKVKSSTGINPATAAAEYSTDGGKTWKAVGAVCSGTAGSTTEETLSSAPVPFISDRSGLNKIRFTVKSAAGADIKSAEYPVHLKTGPVISAPNVTPGTESVNFSVSIQDAGGLRVGRGEAAMKEASIALLHMDSKGTDSSGKGNHAVMKRSASIDDVASWKGEGVQSSAMCFDPGYQTRNQWSMPVAEGQHDYADMGQFPLGSTNELTIAGWVYPRQLGNAKWSGVTSAPLITHGGVPKFEPGLQIATTPAGIIMVSGNTINGFKQLTSFQSEEGVVKVNEWFHFAFTSDKSGARLYVNGNRVAEDTGEWKNFKMYEFRGLRLAMRYGGGNSPTGVPTGLHYDPGMHYAFFDGCMDEIHIANRAFTSAEIASEVYSGQYRYTSDAGKTWSDWQPGNIDVADGSTEVGIMTMTDIPLVPNNDSSAIVEIAARDKNGNATLRRFILLDGEIAVPVTQKPGFKGNLSLSPNPFVHTTAFRFETATPQRVELEIYRLNGEKVKTVVSGFLPAGKHSYNWDGTGTRGQMLKSGQYFTRLKVGKKVVVKRVLKLR